MNTSALSSADELMQIFNRMQSWAYPTPMEHSRLAIELPDDYPLDADGVQISKSLPQVFKSPGGKKWAAKRIVSMIPVHMRYVEAYSGSAAVFWRKDPSPDEVLNDLRQNLIDTFKYIRDTTDFRSIYKKDWRPSRETYMKLHAWKPTEPVDQAYRYLYCARSNMMNQDGGSYSEVLANKNVHPPMIQRFRKWHDRLQGVTLLEMDAMDVIKEYDGAHTFFYLDPPYPKGRDPSFYPGHEYTMADLDKLIALCASLKGKFLMSLNPKSLPKEGLPENLRVKKIAIWYPTLPTSHVDKKTLREGQIRMEVLVNNYL